MMSKQSHWTERWRRLVLSASCLLLPHGVGKVVLFTALPLVLLGLIIGYVAWRKSKIQLETVALLAKAIKVNEETAGVRKVIDTVRSQGRGTPAGDYLDKFLKKHATLAAKSHPALAAAA